MEESSSSIECPDAPPYVGFHPSTPPSTSRSLSVDASNSLDVLSVLRSLVCDDCDDGDGSSSDDKKKKKKKKEYGFYDIVKFVNALRTAVSEGNVTTSDAVAFMKGETGGLWREERFYKPVIKGDRYLMDVEGIVGEYAGRYGGDGIDIDGDSDSVGSIDDDSVGDGVETDGIDSIDGLKEEIRRLKGMLGRAVDVVKSSVLVGETAKCWTEDDVEEDTDDECESAADESAATNESTANESATNESTKESTNISNNKHNSKSGKSSKSSSVDASYYTSYSSHTIHQSMLSDFHRTSTYKSSILLNASHFRGSTVVDVGCGTGVLSVFMHKLGGARKVYAIDNSDISIVASRIMEANGITSNDVAVINSPAEEVVIPEKVDFVVSEWMGYGLMFESMLRDVIRVRDRWMKDTGSMWPNKVRVRVQKGHSYILTKSIRKKTHTHTNFFFKICLNSAQCTSRPCPPPVSSTGPPSTQSTCPQ